ncbi:MAG: trypsin-like peptidase domain-containing protein, partial [Ardenticatenales bacterium]|nr:trypsin-like peptidase domain-containing protein [Ardenticatenales bacterium]
MLLGLVAGGCAGALGGGLMALTIKRGYEVPVLSALVPTQTPTVTMTPLPSATATATASLTPTLPPTPTPTPTATPLPALADVIARVGPSVVTVAVSLEIGEAPLGFGSGVVLYEPDIVITNFHVVEEAAEIRIITQGEQEIAATLVGGDFFTDIAVLRLEEPADLQPLPLAVGEEVRVGEPVFAIGSALGDFRNSVTSGIISGLERLLYLEELGFAYEGLIQTDAAIN